MKKTFNINLGGTSFVIDDDAYELLSQYFDTLSHVYKDSDDSSEFVADIENRVAELLMMKMTSADTIITLAMTEEVIAQIGRPEDFEEVTVTPESVEVKQQTLPPPLPPQAQKVTKRLYRNPNNKLLGGVCSGIAAYLGVDTTWIRLATVAVCFLSFSTAALVYFILWIVIPEAVTPLQQMQMYGESPTFQNIGKQVTGMFNRQNNPEEYALRQESSSGFGYTLSRAFALIAKVIMVIIGIICIPVVLAMLVACVAIVIVLIASLLGLLGGLLPTDIPGDSLNLILLTGLGTTLAVGIPLGVLIWLIGTGSRRTMSKGWQRSLIIAWIIGFVMAVAGSMICKMTDTRSKWADAIEELRSHKSEIESAKDTVITVDSDTTVSVESATGTKVERDSTGLVISKPDGEKIALTKDSVTVTKPGKKRIKHRR